MENIIQTLKRILSVPRRKYALPCDNYGVAKLMLTFLEETPERKYWLQHGPHHAH